MTSAVPVLRPSATHYRDRAAALVDRLPAVVVLPRRAPSATAAPPPERPRRPEPAATRRQLDLPL